jgi:hypothetical protein
VSVLPIPTLRLRCCFGFLALCGPWEEHPLNERNPGLRSKAESSPRPLYSLALTLSSLFGTSGEVAVLDFLTDPPGGAESLEAEKRL